MKRGGGIEDRILTDYNIDEIRSLGPIILTFSHIKFIIRGFRRDN
jgi:hypothetical protein